MNFTNNTAETLSVPALDVVLAPGEGVNVDDTQSGGLLLQCAADGPFAPGDDTAAAAVNDAITAITVGDAPTPIEPVPASPVVDPPAQDQ